MTVDIKTIKVGEIFQKYIRMADGTTKKDGTITCMGFEKNSIILKYENCRKGNFVEKIGKSKAQKCVFGDFLGATRI